MNQPVEKELVLFKVNDTAKGPGQRLLLRKVPLVAPFFHVMYHAGKGSLPVEVTPGATTRALGEVKQLPAKVSLT